MKEFFEKLSKKNNYVDEVVMKKFYYSLIRLIIDELRQNGKVRLPGFGDYKITEYKERKINNVNTGQTEIVPITKIIKFKACTKLKDYIKRL